MDRDDELSLVDSLRPRDFVLDGAAHDSTDAYANARLALARSPREELEAVAAILETTERAGMTVADVLAELGDATRAKLEPLLARVTARDVVRARREQECLQRELRRELDAMRPKKAHRRAQQQRRLVRQWRTPCPPRRIRALRTRSPHATRRRTVRARPPGSSSDDGPEPPAGLAARLLRFRAHLFRGAR